MKIAVFFRFSWPHRADYCGIKSKKPDLLLFLGDGIRDLDKIKAQFPDIPLRAVRGNCDYDSCLPVSDVITADGVNIFFTHAISTASKVKISMLLPRLPIKAEPRLRSMATPTPLE
jgi:hypothetical protein